MSWAAIKTVRDLVSEGIVPCSEDTLRSLAREHNVGRKLGRPSESAAPPELMCPLRWALRRTPSLTER